MPKLTEKKAIVEEITAHLNNSNAVYVTNYTKMSVADMGELRSKFREGKVEFKVYKNTLVKRAMEEVGGYEDLYPFLVEQNGFAFVADELSASATALKDYIKQHANPPFQAAVLDGEYYNESQLDVLAEMESKDEGFADILGLLLYPITNVVSGLHGPGGNYA